METWTDKAAKTFREVFAVEGTKCYEKFCSFNAATFLVFAIESRWFRPPACSCSAQLVRVPFKKSGGEGRRLGRHCPSEMVSNAVRNRGLVSNFS